MKFVDINVDNVRKWRDEVNQIISSKNVDITSKERARILLNELCHMPISILDQIDMSHKKLRLMLDALQALNIDKNSCEDNRCPNCVWAGNIIHHMCPLCSAKMMGKKPWEVNQNYDS